MRLSTRGRYGTRLMLELAKNYGEGPKSVSDISKNLNIPVKYLEQLIIPLKKAALISSVRGPKGGHMLSRPAEEISLWHILTLLETKFSFVDCLTDDGVCERIATCPIRPFWNEALRGMRKLFRETSLLDVLISSRGSQRPAAQNPAD
ncbi:MAG: Rrf2 family transcriptional regulator [Deltaproteobacteria bacterium]|nr:Rrf2 family transcriptional regulator [Deltaproteobacteria bacterium]